MTRGVPCGRSAFLVASLLLIVPLFAGAGAVPNLHPIDTTAQVGTTGVNERVPYASSEGGILVAPGQRITFVADYAFEDTGLPAGGSFNFVATLRVEDATGPLGTVNAVHNVNTGGALQESGTLVLSLGVPEVLRDATVTLESRVYHNTGQTSSLLGEAFATAPISIVAIPEPMSFLTEDLVVAAALDAGTIDFTGSIRNVAATDGHTFVSTDLGARFVATATVERPELQAMSEIYHAVMVTMSIQVEGGASFGVSRLVFMDHCNDWSNHACALSTETRSVDLEIVLPPSVLSPHNVVKTFLYGTEELWYYDSPNGIGDGSWNAEDDRGRHVVVAA